jgi:hypothetical protein
MEPAGSSVTEVIFARCPLAPNAAEEQGRQGQKSGGILSPPAGVSRALKMVWIGGTVVVG